MAEDCQPRKKHSADRYRAGNMLMVLGPVGDCETFYEFIKIEALFKSVGCEIIEGSGSRIAVLHQGDKATFHRPHPGKEALRYRVCAARDFLIRIGVRP